MSMDITSETPNHGTVDLLSQIEESALPSLRFTGTSELQEQWRDTSILTTNPTASTTLSCPYRKRNPIKFNVRASYECAVTAFTDMVELKRHIQAQHGQPPYNCPRCFKTFDTSYQHEQHLRAPKDQMCDSISRPPENPESGIDDKMRKILNDHDKNTSWENLWRLLFPHDSHIPSPATNNPRENGGLKSVGCRLSWNRDSISNELQEDGYILRQYQSTLGRCFRTYR
ncbi:hypothetical protein F5Y16DRAFT_129096 [Xylariaceae sp. FL0255]|nr:hypothetical protein F5Y16DRAFT_129096 [Xylariaceae sp. FL0255]